MSTRKYPEDFINKIICGDCLEVMKEMPDKCVDLVLTDPPYEIAKADWDIRPIGWRKEIERVCKGAIYWFGLPRDIPQKGYRTLIYGKTIPLPRHPMNMQKDWIYSYQPIFYKKGSLFNKPLDRKKSDVLMFHPEVGIAPWYHPTQKPLKLITKLIAISSNEGDIVFDPFLGSGTTIRGAKDLNRNFIGIEINPDYCKIAEERLAQGVL